MKSTAITLFIVSFFILPLASASAASKKPAASKICLITNTGALVVRTKCKKGEALITLSSLSQNVPTVKGDSGEKGEKGEKGDQGIPGIAGATFDVFLSDGSDLDSVVPAATQIPSPGFGIPPTIIPGTLTRNVKCGHGIIVAASCESSVTTDLSIERRITPDGASLACSWANSNLVGKTGRFFSKVICADF